MPQNIDNTTVELTCNPVLYNMFRRLKQEKHTIFTLQYKTPYDCCDLALHK